MKTIQLNVYEFNELSEQAKKKAIDILRECCVTSACQGDWDDAGESQKKLEEIAHVKACIDYSSQGYYCRWYKNTDPQYDMTDEQEFDKFKQNFEEQFHGDTWADDMLYDVVNGYTFDDGRSYESNITSILVKYANEIEQSTIDYYDDDYVIEWIDGNEFMFFEDGRPIREELL